MRISFFLLLAAASWLSAVGGFQLHPDAALLELLFPVERQPWGFDPALVCAWVAGTAQVLSLALLMFGWPGSALSATLATTCWWAAFEHGWLMQASATEALAHLALTAALVTHWRGYSLAALPLALPILALQPSLAWMLIAAWPLEALLHPTQPRLRQAAAGAAALALAALYLQAWPTPDFSWSGWFWLVPVAWSLSPQATRPWLALELGCQLSGQPGLGAAAAVAAGAGEYMAQHWAGDLRLAPSWDGEKLELNLSHKAMILICVIGLLYFGALPGESRFNRELLLEAQRRKIPLSRLLSPQPLKSWCLEHGLTSDDVKLAQEAASKSGSVVILTPGRHRESKLEHGLLAALAGKQLAGWKSGETLPGVQLARLLAKPELAGADHVLLRQPFPSRLVLEHMEPIARQAMSYQVFRNGEPWGSPINFSEGPSLFRLPVTPGNYEVAGRSWKITTPKLKASWLEPEKQPSRSLVKLQLQLTNLSEGEFDLSRVRALTLTTDHPSFPAPRQSWQGLGLLSAGTTTELPAWLATPEPEGTYRLQLTLHADQGDIVLDIQQPLRCWRRLPPVGTWVEP